MESRNHFKNGASPKSHTSRNNKTNLLRYILIIAIVCISSLSNAQDIISLKKGGRIEATITEIKGNTINYKYFSEPKGKVRFVYKDMVSSILYQDGTIEKFDEPKGPMPSDTQKKTSSDTQKEKKAATDILILKDGQRIEAIVTEIKGNIVSYLYLSDSQSRIRSIYTDDLSSIVYRNGSIEQFNESKPLAQIESQKKEEDTNNLQDLIIKKSGEKIKAKVLEVGVKEVKYKKYNDEISPTYALNKSEIFMILYENGDNDIFSDRKPNYNSPNNSDYNRKSSANNISHNEKNPTIAFLFSFLIAGGGQFYNGEIAKGCVLLGMDIAGYAIVIDGANKLDNGTMSAGLGIIALSGLISMIDAPISANRINRKNFLSWNIGGDKKVSLRPDITLVNTGINMKKETMCGLALKLSF